LCTAVGHLRRIDQRAGAHLAGGQIAKFYLTVHGHHVSGHVLRRTHLRAIQLVVQGAGDRQRGKGRLLQQAVNTLSIEFVNDNGGSGHYLLHVVNAATTAEDAKRKPSPSGSEGLTMTDNTESAPGFEVMAVTFMAWIEFRAVICLDSMNFVRKT